MRIAVTYPDAALRRQWADALSAQMPEATVFCWPDRGDAGPAAPVSAGRPRAGSAAEPVLYGTGWAPSAEFFAAHPQMKFFLHGAAGVDRLVLGLALPAGLSIVRLEDAGMAEQMADYCCREVLGLLRGFDTYAAQQRDARWHQLPVASKREMPVGVFGLGVLGTHIAGVLRDLGFAVRGYSRRPSAIAGVECFDERHGLRQFLAGCKVLILIAPLTADTHDLFDSTRLGWLPPGAWLINIARGRLVVDDALITALDSGHLSGATLDVFREEPLPASHPFWQHPKVRVTPHVAGITLVDESVSQIAEKIRRIERGEPVSGIVDLTRGY